jgi:4-hydroxybenzoate polyprenyltransferase
VTALADVLAGWAVAGVPLSGRLLWLLGATACLYAGGVVLNDVFDRSLDAIERPERPIPSGKISPVTAGSIGAGLLATGILFAAGGGATAALVAAGITLAVVVYDKWGKHHVFLGPINMGLCRALNLGLGIAVAPTVLASHWPLMGFPLLYISAVTVLSRGEVHGAKQGVARLALALTALVIAGLAVLAGSQTVGLHRAAGLVVAGVLAWRVLGPMARAAHALDSASIRQAVRAGVLSLVLLDTVIAVTYADIMYGWAVLATGLVASRLARWFAVT